jgi:AcrR family transcriptional regulator
MAVEPTTGRRERKRRQTYDALRDHAQALFRQNGFEATTVAQIAEAADVSEPTFFRHFGSKADVALAPLTESIRRAVHAVMARPIEEPPLTACRAVARVASQAGLVPSLDVLADVHVIRGSASLETSLLRVFDDASEELAADFARRLGVSASDPVARQTALAVMATIHSVFRCWMDDPKGTDRPKLLLEGLDRLADGLR